jgi:hypothetical protein
MEESTISTLPISQVVQEVLTPQSCQHTIHRIENPFIQQKRHTPICCSSREEIQIVSGSNSFADRALSHAFKLIVKNTTS